MSRWSTVIVSGISGPNLVAATVLFAVQLYMDFLRLL